MQLKLFFKRCHFAAVSSLPDTRPFWRIYVSNYTCTTRHRSRLRVCLARKNMVTPFYTRSDHAQHFTCHMYKHVIPAYWDDMLVASLLLACDCVGEEALACLFRGIDGQLGDVDVAWLFKHLD